MPAQGSGARRGRGAFPSFCLSRQQPTAAASINQAINQLINYSINAFPHVILTEGLAHANVLANAASCVPTTPNGHHDENTSFQLPPFTQQKHQPRRPRPSHDSTLPKYTHAHRGRGGVASLAFLLGDNPPKQPFAAAAAAIFDFERGRTTRARASGA